MGGRHYTCLGGVLSACFAVTVPPHIHPSCQRTHPRPIPAPQNSPLRGRAFPSEHKPRTLVHAPSPGRARGAAPFLHPAVVEGKEHVTLCPGGGLSPFCSGVSKVWGRRKPGSISPPYLTIAGWEQLCKRKVELRGVTCQCIGVSRVSGRSPDLSYSAGVVLIAYFGVSRGCSGWKGPLLPTALSSGILQM